MVYGVWLITLDHGYSRHMEICRTFFRHGKGVWCIVHLVYSTRYMVCDVKYMVYGVRCMVCGVGVWCMMCVVASIPIHPSHIPSDHPSG